MESKAKPGAGLEHTDMQIASLFQKHLPTTPHIFYVPTDNPYLPNFPHENLNIPFERCEIPKLQYMTLISNGDRGVGASKGASDWEDEIYGKSPLSAAGHSSTSTPNPVRDLKKPSQKISFGDYKNYKQTGVKPSPRPYTATPEQKARQDAPGHSRNTSAISAITHMGRVPSSDGGDLKPVAKATIQDNERSSIPRSTHTDTREAAKPRPVTNGHREPVMAKDSSKDSRTSSKPEHTHSIKEPMKHPLPPRPQSPPRSNPEHKKRPLESGETHPEKRLKIIHAESRTPTNSHKDTPRKAEPTASETKPSPSKSQKQSSQAASSPLPKKSTSTIKIVDSKAHPSKSTASNSEKPLDLPPLLSPLPADLGPSPEPHFAFAAVKKTDTDKVTPPKTPSQKKALGSDTIVVKQPHIKGSAAASSPLSDPPKSSPQPFVLPRLLSPGLPDIIEEELIRLQQKSATLNTVEARHEKARLPDTPGVARKTPKPKGAKVGHPPKRDKAESSKLPTVPEIEVKKSFIVKIPYKKRQARDIQRYLALTQKPRGQMERLEASERLARERSTSAAPPLKDDSESEEDVPLSKSRATKTPVAAATTTKKRPTDSTERNEPAPKRSKLPESLDVVKASTPVTPAFKSPALSAPPSAQKSLLATPKKGDAMKSVSAAMRRVDSNDGLARTPQTTSISTPASAEKPRPNGIEARPNPEIDKQKADEAKFFSLGTTLKRKMDSLISPKNRDPSAPIPDSERKAGHCIGVESLMAYMLAFHARGRISHLRSVPPDPGSWDGFLKLQTFLQNATRHFVELHALIEQMGAVAREMLNRDYMEHLALVKDGGNVEKIARDTKENSRLRDQAWNGVKRNERMLRELGVKREGLGPWSTVHDAVSLAAAVLTVYSGREKLEWSPDAQFAAAREASSK